VPALPFSRLALAAAAAAGILAAGSLAGPIPASAASADLVISQLYGGGGNSGSVYTNDFVELQNRGTAAADVSGWTVQYSAAAGTSWQVTVLSGSIAPGAHYLVGEAKGTGGTTALPKPDATGSISMSATAGKVALVHGTAALSCGSACAKATGVADFVGFGSASESETAPVTGMSNTLAAVRGEGPDTDDNSTDFSAGTPNPRNTGAEPGPSPSPSPAPVARIHDVQGAAHVSPLVGKQVSAVAGIVTAVAANGFWFQDPQPDASPATSEGLFVFTSSAPSVAVGDAVTVSGTVTEYRPGGSGGSTNLSTTEISKPSVTVVSHGAAVPAAALVGPGALVAPAAVRTDAPGDVESSPVFDPAANALDFYESLEGMLVQVTDSIAVGPTASFGEIPVLPGGKGSPRTGRGGVLYSYADSNTDRVFLDDLLAPLPMVNVGDKFKGAITGVLDYSFGNVKLEVLATPVATDRTPPRERTVAQKPDELAVATFNVENLDPSDPAAKFGALADVVVANLASPDVLALEEIQDNNGATDDGTVAADQTYAKLTAAIAAAGGPAYQVRQIDPGNKTDGGEPGGNIRVGFLFNPARVSFTDRPGGTTTSATGVTGTGKKTALTFSPGRIDPGNPAFADSRKPLAGEFVFHGGTVFVVASHFGSKGGDQPLNGRFQPPARSSENKRHEQATAVKAFTDQLLAADPQAAIVVAGDLNDFEFSQTAAILTAGGGMIDLPRTLPLPERFSYVYEGNSQVLDHMLVSHKLARNVRYDYDIVHVNSEYSDQISDHDPQVVRLYLGPL
jgi:predicted extracellular nuclease